MGDMFLIVGSTVVYAVYVICGVDFLSGLGKFFIECKKVLNEKK